VADDKVRVEVKMDKGWEQKLDPEMKHLLTRVSDLILADAKDEVPVRTGRLRDSLMAEVSDGEARVGSRDVEYAEDVELGTDDQQAHPYLKPALYKPRTVGE
jgi:hypothetical protein